VEGQLRSIPSARVNPHESQSWIPSAPVREATRPFRVQQEVSTTAPTPRGVPSRQRDDKRQLTPTTPWQTKTLTTPTLAIDSPATTQSTTARRSREGETISIRAEPPLAPGGAIRVPQGSAGPAASKDHDGSISSEQASRTEGGVRHVHVTIGRVEVRAVAPEPAARRTSATQRPTALSLDEYLRRRGQP